MIMLSNVSIKKFLDSKDIIIAPFEEEMMEAARVTLHLGLKILVPKSGVVVDVKNNILPEYEEIEMTDDSPFELMPNQFVLGETFEEIGISEKIGMLIEGRSTFARLGISVVQTAMIVDTGQKQKKMTLEIKNSGVNSVLLYPKLRFCRAVFFELNPPADSRYDIKGRYQSGDLNKPIFREEFKRR